LLEKSQCDESPQNYKTVLQKCDLSLWAAFAQYSALSLWKDCKQQKLLLIKLSRDMKLRGKFNEVFIFQKSMLFPCTLTVMDSWLCETWTHGTACAVWNVKQLRAGDPELSFP
jgi:hypothetical protein